MGYFEKKNRNLDKQITLSSTIKHQRDKQIFIVHRAGIQSFNLSEGYQYSSSLKKFIYIDYQYISSFLVKFVQINHTI